VPTKILIVEDEEKIARFLELELRHEGYDVSKAADGRTGLSLAEAGGFDLILLDILLPELSGLEVIRRLRRASDVPVIMLTARDAVMDKVSGLDMGADDYITKPFAIEELLARIRVVMRKKQTKETALAQDSVLTCGRLKLDKARHTVSYDGTPVELTNREFVMLQFMMENEGIVLSRDTFLERVWGYDYMGETNIVDVYIRYLRAKLDEAFGVNMIVTIRGAGYVLKGGADERE
jgi:DNA-binding response OmpR family regulator